jgi:dihydrofolate reductase
VRSAPGARHDVADAIKKLKQEPGKDLLQYGVGELTHTMLKHGLVDELRILVFPFAFGQGPRVFERMGVHTLKLLDTKTFDSGVVALRYEPRG